MNSGFHTTYHSQLSDLGVGRLEGEYRQLFVTPSWSWRINGNHAVGVVVNVALLWVRFGGIQFTAFFSFWPTDVSNRGTDFQESVSVRFGWLMQPCSSLRLDATSITGLEVNLRNAENSAGIAYSRRF